MIREDIVDFLVHNRVSTTEVADALGKKGALVDIKAINRGHYCAGVVKYIYAYNESNYPVHEQIEGIEEKQIVFVDSFFCNGRAIFGELVSKYLLLYRQSRGLIVDGNVRDAAELYRENYPIWCKGFNPIGCYNKKPENDIDKTIVQKRRDFYEGAIAVCDDCGVVIIPKEVISEELLIKLQKIENQEDIWFDRLNHYKESTFEIVCKKNYMNDMEYMRIRKKIEEEV